MKLGVVGSQTGIPREKVDMILDDLKSKNQIDLIVSGGAIGVDTFAVDWAKKNKIKYKEFEPEWTKFGRPAGPIRNQKIVDESDEVALFWDGKSPGTASTLKMVEKAGKVFHLNIGGENVAQIQRLLGLENE